MTMDFRRVAVGIAILASGVTLVGPAPMAHAQERPPLPPEVIEILGQPESEGAALDADVIAVLGQPQEAPPVTALVASRSADFAAKLRCPVCQGVSIADSPSSMATNMRSQVRELVAKGYSEDQVLSYFERSYGEFVRLEPSVSGLNMMLWVLPVMVLLGGATFVVWKARQPAARAAADPAQTATRAKMPEADPALARYLEKIRRDSGISS